MPRSGECISNRAQTCPTINNYVFSTSSPNTATWYAGKVDYNISSKQKLSFSFNYYPNFVDLCCPGSSVPQRRLGVYPKGITDNLTGQLTDVYTISPIGAERVSCWVEAASSISIKPPSLW